MDQIVISGKRMEVARVAWFNPQKLYGFAQIWNRGASEEIFFHFNDGRLVDVDETIRNLVFKSAADSRALVFPRSGDDILITRTLGKQGKPKASPWTPLDDFVILDDYLREQNEVCVCGHKTKDHAGGECMSCDCGHDDWSWHDPENFRDVKLPDGRMGVQVVDDHEVNAGDSVGSFKIQE
jgi:hypothetical protein